MSATYVSSWLQVPTGGWQMLPVTGKDVNGLMGPFGQILEIQMQLANSQLMYRYQVAFEL